MRAPIKLLTVIFLYTYFSQNIFAQAPNCGALTPGLIPLTDLGPGFFEGYQGGLFPGGANAENPASSHFKKGRSFAKNLQPLDSLGNINYDRGVILMGGFGPSIPGHLMDELVPIVRDTTDDIYKTNICFDAINMSAGGKGLDYAIGSDSTKYWNNMKNKITGKGYNILQMQVGWIYFNDKWDTAAEITFPDEPMQVADDLTTYLQLLKIYFPNIKIVFVSGRHYGGFCDTLMEQYAAISEPSSYYNNFAVKWLIERQITGDPDLRYFGINTKVPFITWGNYFWTNGASPRITDGRNYPCEKFSVTDGYHLTDSTNVEDANYMMNYFYTSEFSKYYVKYGIKWAECVPYLDSIHRETDYVNISESGFTLYPNPANELINIYIQNETSLLSEVEIYNETGTRVHTEKSTGTFNKNLAIDIEDLPAGLYFIRIKLNQAWLCKTFIKQ